MTYKANWEPLTACLDENKLQTWSLGCLGQMRSVVDTNGKKMLLGNWARCAHRAGPTPLLVHRRFPLIPARRKASPTSLRASPFIRTYTGTWGNPVHTQENDTGPKQPRFKTVAYHLRRPVRNISPPVMEALGALGWLFRAGHRCLSQHSRALPSQWLLTLSLSLTVSSVTITLVFPIAT